MNAWYQAIDGLPDWISSGYVPTVGYLFVYGSNYFETSMFVGRSEGFGFFEKEPIGL